MLGERAGEVRLGLFGCGRNECGATLAESAICYGLIFTCLFGVIQFCMLVYTYGVYAEAARAGVRYAVEHGTDSSTCSGPSTGCGDSTGANVVSAVNSYAAQFVAKVPGVQVNVTYPDASSAPPSRVVVKVTYTYTPFLKGSKGVSQAMGITTQGRIIY
jgi:Flp pilus assembly protein TadG